jgi:hypothetical protein
MQGLALINLCLTMFIVLVLVLKNFEAIIEMLDSGVLRLFLQLSQLASFAPKTEFEDIWRNIFGIKIVPPSSCTYFLSFLTCFRHWRGFSGFFHETTIHSRVSSANVKAYLVFKDRLLPIA